MDFAFLIAFIAFASIFTLALIFFITFTLLIADFASFVSLLVATTLGFNFRSDSLISEALSRFSVSGSRGENRFYSETTPFQFKTVVPS